MAVVEVLRTRRARDTTLALLDRNIWLICAIFNIHTTGIHTPDKSNMLTDLLSRWQFTAANSEDLIQILLELIWILTHLDLTLLNYNTKFLL